MLKKMKCLLVSLAVIIGVIVPQTAFAAPSDVKVLLDGQEIAYDVPPQIIEGRTMVPLSKTIEEITGSSANWDGATKTVAFSAKGHTYVHQIGQTVVYMDGTPVQFDTPSQIIESRTLVPVRMIAETSGYSVEWDAGNRQVIITSPESAAPTSDAPKILEFAAPLGTKLAKGSDFKVNVTTNGTALSVWVEGLGGEAWQGMLVDAGNEDGKPKWEVTCYPLSDGRMKIYAAGVAGTLATEIVEIAFTEAAVSAGDSAPLLLSFTTTSGTRLNKGEKFMANVTANGAVLYVWAEGQNGEKWQGELVDAGNEDGMPKWEVTFTPTGSGQVKIYAGSSDKADGAIVKTVDIMVGE